MLGALLGFDGFLKGAVESQLCKYNKLAYYLMFLSRFGIILPCHLVV